jgi:hypothetical protein
MGNGAGQTDSHTFIPVSGLDPASTIAVGQSQTCAMLTADASVQCWGIGTNGVLGTGNSAKLSSPGPATELNTGLANVQLIVSWKNTYVDL